VPWRQTKELDNAYLMGIKKIGVGSVGVTTAKVFGGKRLTQAVLSGRGVCRVGKKEMSARNLHFFYFIYF
jgi:hypothetical protein